MPPTISVVIPTYNSGRWVEKTLESVLQQTFPLEQVELIVIDDCSPDDSVRVARSFLEGKPIDWRVVEREKNRGVAVNRNAGWQMAKGDWIQFVDADDLLMPHKLELQAKVAVAAPQDVAVVYSSWRFLESKDGVWEPTGPINAPFVDENTIVRILEDVSFGYVGPTLMRRAALVGVEGFEERPNLGEDMSLMLRIAMAGGKFREARSEGKPAFLYRQSPGSLWRVYVKNITAMRNLLRTFRQTEEYLRSQRPAGDLADDARHALAMRYTKWANFYLEHDPETFREVMTWLRGLGFDQPPNLGLAMKTASAAIGYENALRVRSKYRRIRGKD